jgi:hypothetical protein
MNSKEQEDVVRTAAVIRTARKLRGKIQIEVANHLGVSQSFLSKLEHARLIPSSSQWFLFCRFMGINPARTFESGFIDHCLSVAGNNPYPQSLFKVHPRYDFHHTSKVRSVLPFIQYFTAQLGEGKFDKFCEENSIDPDFFRVLDNQLNITFTLDLITTLMKKGVLKRTDLQKLVQPISTPLIHGNLHEDYDQMTGPLELVQCLIQNKEKYETNFKYQLEEKDNRSLVVSVAPNPVLTQFDYKNELLGDFLCQYKQQYFKRFASYKAAGELATIEEKQCHFHGHERCIYEIRAVA